MVGVIKIAPALVPTRRPPSFAQLRNLSSIPGNLYDA
jgi:hypothetical protein